MTVLKSSVIDNVDYNEATQELRVTFHSGTTYTYEKVPAQVFRDLTLAESSGRYFQKSIKPHYRGVKVQ